MRNGVEKPALTLSVSVSHGVFALFDVLWVLCVVEKHGKNHRLQITHGYNSQRCATVQFVNICNFGATCRVAFLLNVYLNVCCLFLKNTHRGVWYVHGLGLGAYDHKPLR